MARSISEEEIQLKKRARRRLVGAAVLVTVVAVVLPMVLDTEPKQVNQNVDIQIPSPDAGPYDPKIAPSQPAAESKRGSDTPQAPGPSVAPAPKAGNEPSSPAPVATEKKGEPASGEAADKRAASTPEPAKARESAGASPTEAPKSTPSGKFVVQLAALADPAKAKQLQQKAAHEGLRSYTEVVKTARGRVTRVRAGPYATREAAEKARAQLKAAGLDGKVVAR